MGKGRFTTAGLIGSGAVMTALSLAGCSSLGSSGNSSSSNSFANLLFLQTTNPEPAKGPQVQPNFNCPSIEVQPGAASYQVYAPGKEENAESVRYQTSFRQYARECEALGAEAGIRIGVIGRVVVGPQGTAGQTVEVPVRVSLVDDDNKPQSDKAVFP